MKRVAGPHDAARSVSRGQALTDLRKELGGIRFPISKEELLDRAGDTALHLSPAGPVSLRDLLASIPEVTLFRSADHVAEVVAIEWQDLADVFRPGGGG